MNCKFHQELLIESIRIPMYYLTMQFKLGDKIFNFINGRSIAEIDEKLQALIEFHNQIMDDLYIISLALSNGFPLPAAKLMSSVFEFSHKAIFIFNNPQALQIWMTLPDLKIEFDKELGKKFYPDKKSPKISLEYIVKNNIEQTGIGEIQLEYGIYQQLCRIKHPHQQFVRLSPGGNRSDPTAIQNSWFVAKVAGKCSAYVTQLMIINYPNLFPPSEFEPLHNDIYNLGVQVDTEVKRRFPECINNPLI